MMEFLRPKPVKRRPVRTKDRKTSDKTSDMRSIFDKIRDLCRTPEPVVTRIEESVFVSNLFREIKELCRRPDLLSPIEEPLEWSEDSHKDTEVDQPVVVEEKVYKKSRKQYYSDSSATNDSFDLIKATKIFAELIKRKQALSGDNSAVMTANSGTTDKVCESDNKTKCKSNRKRSTVKCCAKSGRKPLKPNLSIECDITSKITKYSMIYSKPKLKNNKKSSPKSESLSQQTIDSTISESNGLTDCSYESIASPSVSTCATNSYSMPATPISSDSSCISQSSYSSVSSASTQSLLRQIRNSLNSKHKYETYGQYVEKCDQNKSKPKTCKRVKKPDIDYKQKVLEWKANGLCSGNSTPVHNIEYLVTPPGSPKPIHYKHNAIENDDFTDLMNSLQNDNFIENDDNFNYEFNSLLSELYSDLNSPSDTTCNDNEVTANLSVT